MRVVDGAGRYLMPGGGMDVQWSGSTVEPGEAHEALRGTVADLLDARTPPTAGMEVDVAGTRHRFVAGSDMLRRIPVLDLTPVEPAGSSAQHKRKRRWFGQRD